MVTQPPAMILTVAVLLAVFMIGTGITGLVVSETCCTGASCPADSVCDELQSPTPLSSSPTATVGILILLVAIATYAAFYLSHKRSLQP